MSQCFPVTGAGTTVKSISRHAVNITNSAGLFLETGSKTEAFPGGVDHKNKAINYSLSEYFAIASPSL